MACNTLIKAHFSISEQSLSFPLSVACSIWQLGWSNKFVPLSAPSMVAVVQRKGVSRNIARSTTLCKSINRSSTGSLSSKPGG